MKIRRGVQVFNILSFKELGTNSIMIQWHGGIKMFFVFNVAHFCSSKNEEE